MVRNPIDQAVISISNWLKSYEKFSNQLMPCYHIDSIGSAFLEPQLENINIDMHQRIDFFNMI